MDSLKNQAIKGMIWTFTQQFSVQFINLIVQIILARLLAPEMFGLIAMLNIFISIGPALIDGGMTSSLIRTRDPDQLDYSTVFMTNMSVSIVVYCLVFFLAPSIASFYDQETLKGILRVYALTFVIRAFVAVHIAKLTKEMNFKTLMKLQIPSTITGGIVGIVMAYNGYGVWSLVWLNLSQTIVFTIQNWLFIKWRPSFVFNKERYKHHFNFGYKITLSGLLDATYSDAYRIVIGKFFSPTMTGYYNQAETLRSFPVIQLSAVLNKVTYPLFSGFNDDVQLKRSYKAAMKLLLLAVVPVMMVLIVVANEVFLILFGQKWLPAVPYFQILCFASIVRPLSSYNLTILKVKGRSDLLLKVEAIKKVFGLIVIFLAVPFGMIVLVTSAVVVAYLSSAIDMIVSGKHINYTFKEQLKDVIKIFLIGLFCLFVSYYLRSIFISHVSPFILILIISFLFVFLYLLLIFIFDKETILLIKKLVVRKR